MLLNLSKIFYEVLLSNFLIGQEADWPDLMPAELRADQSKEIQKEGETISGTVMIWTDIVDNCSDMEPLLFMFEMKPC